MQLLQSWNWNVKKRDGVLVDHNRDRQLVVFFQRRKTNNGAKEAELIEWAFSTESPPIHEYSVQKSTTITEWTIEDDELIRIICNICFINQQNIVFLLCWHVITSATCTNSIRLLRCPICGKFVTWKTKLSFC